MQRSQRHTEGHGHGFLGKLSLSPLISLPLTCVPSQVSFPVGGQAREHLIRDLQRDVDFLESANIMDYSLFVAFWYVPQTEIYFHFHLERLPLVALPYQLIQLP
jgi:hypothetical protein